jgi:2-C-methyl-D-erythritol 4-phosphate cytidylyltransferase
MLSSTAPQGDISVLIPAAGKSLRYAAGSEGRSKLAERIAGRSVLGWAVAAFLHRADVAEVVVATGDLQGVRALLDGVDGADRVRVVRGGDCRAASVWEAAKASSPQATLVAVHDAARPAVSQELIDRVVAAARQHVAAGPAMAVSLTIKQASGPLPARIERTIPRQSLWAMQTPQVMRRADLLRAFDLCPLPLDQVTDDLQLLELCGIAAVLVEGEERNLKITHAQDLDFAQRALGGPTA